MHFRVRTLLILLAVGLVLLEVGLYLLPDRVNLPGEMLTWMCLVVAFHYVIPIAVIATLVALAIMHSTQGAESWTVPVTLRFTIRDLLWLTALVALWFVWRWERQLMISQYYDVHRQLYESQLREY